jgi:uncharacterized protein (TIGR03067 family)
MRMLTLWLTVVVGLLLSGPFASSNGDAKKEAMQKYVAGLKGKWQMVSRVEDGVASDEDLIKRRTITFEEGRYTVRDADAVYAKATYKIDVTKTPIWFDITHASGPNKGRVERGIIKVEGDTMTFCLGPPGGNHPAEFTSPKGQDNVLVVYKRVKR